MGSGAQGRHLKGDRTAWEGNGALFTRPHPTALGVQFGSASSCSVHSRFSSIQFCPFRFPPSSVQFASLRFRRSSVQFASPRFTSPRFTSLRLASVRFGPVQFGSDPTLLLNEQKVQSASVQSEPDYRTPLGVGNRPFSLIRHTF